jgi:hypothetical protein
LLPPFATIVPSVAFPPAIPFTLQVTLPDSEASPLTLAVNPCAPPVPTVAAAGEMVTAITLCSVTVADALALASAWLMALTVTLGFAGNEEGAV